MRGPVQKVVLVAAAFAVAGCADVGTPVSPNPAALTPATNPRFDSYVVVLRPGRDAASVRAGSRLGSVVRLYPSARAQNLIVRESIPALRALVVEGAQVAEDISGDDVEQVIPNYEHDIIEPASSWVVGDELAFQDPTGTNQSSASLFAANWQWGYKKISVNRVWVPSRGGAGAKVCIIDSGIDPGHISLTGKSIVSTSFVANSSAQTDTNGHGSHVAGTVSTNGVGLASTAPDVGLMTAKVFAATGGASSTAVWNGIIWCADNGADVINMSLGFTGGVPTVPANQAFIDFYQTVLDYATNAGVLIVASAGNDAATLPVAGRKFIPAEMAGVTSVAATSPTSNLSPFGINATWSSPGTAFDGIASYSNRGGVPSVDISAPGGDFFTGWPAQSLIVSVCSRQFRSGSSFPCASGSAVLFSGGTSMAAPHVSGVAALIRARWPSSPRSLTLRNKVESCLYRSVDNIGSTLVFGRGRLNAYKAATMPC